MMMTILHRRFLSDLQTEVGVAILREQYEQNLANLNSSESRSSDSTMSDSTRSSTESSETTQESQTSSQTTQTSNEQSAASPRSTAGVPPNFAFFRSFRWPNRFLNASGWLEEEPFLADNESSLSNESSPPVVLESSPTGSADSTTPALVTDPPSLPDMSNGSDPAAAPPQTARAAQSSAPLRPGLMPVTPILFVGVRSVSAEDSSPFFDPSHFFSNLMQSAMASPASGESVLQDGPARQPDESEPIAATESATPREERIADMQEMANQLMSDDGSSIADTVMEDASATSTEQPTTPAVTATPSAAPQAPPPPSAFPQAPSGHHWLIYMSAGFYPVNSPVTQFPVFLAALENTNSYEDFIRLAEMLGNAKAATVSKEQLDQSGLQVVTGRTELQRLQAEGNALENTTERCLICLEAYAEDDSVRLLSCKHAFHQLVAFLLSLARLTSCKECASTDG